MGTEVDKFICFVEIADGSADGIIGGISVNDKRDVAVFRWEGNQDCFAESIFDLGHKFINDCLLFVSELALNTLGVDCIQRVQKSSDVDEEGTVEGDSTNETLKLLDSRWNWNILDCCNFLGIDGNALSRKNKAKERQRGAEELRLCRIQFQFMFVAIDEDLFDMFKMFFV